MVRSEGACRRRRREACGAGAGGGAGRGPQRWCARARGGCVARAAAGGWRRARAPGDTVGVDGLAVRLAPRRQRRAGLGRPRPPDRRRARGPAPARPARRGGVPARCGRADHRAGEGSEQAVQGFLDRPELDRAGRGRAREPLRRRGRCAAGARVRARPPTAPRSPRPRARRGVAPGDRGRRSRRRDARAAGQLVGARVRPRPVASAPTTARATISCICERTEFVSRRAWALRPRGPPARGGLARSGRRALRPPRLRRGDPAGAHGRAARYACGATMRSSSATGAAARSACGSSSSDGGMAAIKKDGLDQFRIRFGEPARRRGEPVQIDPFLDRAGDRAGDGRVHRALRPPGGRSPGTSTG